MDWLLPVYLLVLVYLTTHRDRVSKSFSLKAAWTWFSLIPISRFMFALFTAGNINSTRDLALVQTWSDGFGWLLLGISFFCLTGLMEQRTNTDQT